MHLNYKQFGSGFPLIILHGLLGSLDNWQSIAKKLAENYTIYIIDQRNHGRSPHSDSFDYNLLSADLLEFMQQQQISKAHLIGHSMGGKAVMQFALQHPEHVAKLIVVDIVPAAFDDRHSDVFEALFAANVETAASREQVQEILRHKLNDETTVQFLLKSLTRAEDGNSFKWRFNTAVLWKNYNKISAAIESDKPYQGPTLFIKGERSAYINTGNYSSITDLFPNHELVEIKGAGHWVQAEKPADFVKAVQDFLKS